METRHLKAFQALVRTMHFGRAAELLGLSQPALSQQIRMLEDEVGAPLVNRSNRTTTLTTVGKTFAEDVERILAMMEEAKRSAADILSGEAAEVRLGVCPGIISSGFLITLLAESRRRWPLTRVRVEVAPPADFVRRLADGRIDLYAGLSTGIDFPEEMKVEQILIAEWDAVLAVPRSLLGLEASGIAMERLKTEPFIYLEGSESAYPHVVERILGFTPRETLSTPSSRLMMAYVDAGYGVALIPSPDAAMKGSNTLIWPVAGGRGIMRAEAARKVSNNAPAVLRLFRLIAALSRAQGGEDSGV